jgi:hypothetical protein
MDSGLSEGIVVITRVFETDNLLIKAKFGIAGLPHLLLHKD